MSKFNRDNFFYGYKAEMVFQQAFPEAKKLVNSADFRLGEYLIEVGRSRILEAHIVVYYRKLFYNIKKENHDMKKKDPVDCFELVKNNYNYYIVPPEKFMFVYFTKTLKHYTVFTYGDLLRSELKRKISGEPFFDVKGNGLKKTKNITKELGKILGYEKPKMCIEDFGVFLND